MRALRARLKLVFTVRSRTHGKKGLIRMTSGRRFRLVCLGFAFFLSCLTFRIVNAGSTPEQVLENFNSASTSEEANKYLTGRLKAQLAGLSGETREKVLQTVRMNITKL